MAFVNYECSIYVVGCGGIGGYLLDMLPQVMACLNVDNMGSAEALAALNSEGLEVSSSSNMFKSLVLVDGDEFSGHNALRQEATAGSKLVVQMNKVRSKDAFTTWLNTTALRGYNMYVTPANIREIFSTVSFGLTVVFLCVDNHKSRYEISKWLEEHWYARGDNLLIINGGNKKTSGNVTVFAMSGGKRLDPPIYKLYPEINDKYDLRPDEVHCGTVALSNDQTAITNNMIASIMLSMFSKAIMNGVVHGFEQQLRQVDANGERKVVRKNEVIVDFNTMTMQALSHSKDLDNTRLQSLLEGAPADSELS